LKLAWSLELRRVILELNSSLMIQLITRLTAKIDTNHILVMKARELIAKNWKVRIQHVFRKANAAAD
jgi:hypothetical protein